MMDNQSLFTSSAERVVGYLLAPIFEKEKACVELYNYISLGSEEDKALKMKVLDDVFVRELRRQRGCAV